MADLIYMFTGSSSIEHMLKKFEERDNNGRLRYSRIMLRLSNTFGSSMPLRISLIISRGYAYCEDFMTFSELKSIVCTSRGYFYSSNEIATMLNKYINDYSEYLAENVYKQSLEKKTYDLNSEIIIGGRISVDKSRLKFGECHAYVIRALEIQPYARNWRQRYGVKKE